MEKKNRASQWVFVAGILIVILGLIHIAATPIVFRMDFGKLPTEAGLAFIYVFVATGVAVVFAGLLAVYGAIGIKRSERMARPLTVGVGIFMSLVGVGAVVTMSDNPFAYMGLALALVEMAPLMIYRQALAIR
ncbi:MAG: hypothetical protein GY832_21220 [Chloroflexi bacterium]|nr:hypothetical protein [Chloroflexota bacterium]